MKIDNLMVKSNQNLKSAGFAYDNKCYNSSVGLYYYTIFQKINYILKYNQIKVKFDSRQNTHDTTYYCFLDLVSNSYSHIIGIAEMSKLSGFGILKDLRNIADYKSELVDKSKVDANFIPVFYKVNAELNRIVGECKGDE